jgi:hypothetical protein
MMREMVQCVAQNDMPRCFHHQLASSEQPPLRRHQEVVGRFRERLASLDNMPLESLDELAGGRLLILSTACRRIQVELVLLDDQRHP